MGHRWAQADPTLDVTQSSESLLSLLPMGQHQCWATGQAFASRYLASASCAAAGGSAGEPNNTCLSPPGSPGASAGLVGNYGVREDPNATW